MHRSLRVTMVIILIFLFGVPSSTLLAQGNVVGTTYTSPHFAYQVQWSTPWYFIEEGTDNGRDYVVISDGLSYVDFSFVFDPSADADEILGLIIDARSTGDSVANVQPLVDAQGIPISGGDSAHAWGGLTGTETLDDGTALDIVYYTEIRVLAGGVVSWVDAFMPAYFYDDSVLLGWQNLISTSLLIPETAEVVPTTAPPAETAVPLTESPTPMVASGAGEPAPAFAAGPWRIAPRAVDQGEVIEYLGLGFTDGMRWVIVYTDVTNWSATDATLDTAGMALVTAGGLVAPDQASTQAAATSLGLEPANGARVAVPAGGSTRLALVYSIPTADSELVMEMAGTQLPLEDAVGRQLNVSDPGTIATPPEVISGIVAAPPVPIGDVVSLAVDTGSETISVTLAGIRVPMPEETSCYDLTPTLQALVVLTGGPIWLEQDPAMSDPDAYYVWYEDESGNRALLNQTLVANGLAVESDVPEAARFGAWIERSEKVAEADGAGLWSTCAGQL